MRLVNFPDGGFYNADCLDAMSRLPAGCVDMILADLPYGTTQNKWDSVIPFEPLWREYWRVLKRNGAVVLTAQSPFDKVLGASQISHLKYEWIWRKSQPTGHLNANKAPLKAHENVLVFYREQVSYSPIKTTGHKRVRATSHADKQSSNYGSQTDKRFYDSTERFPTSILDIPKDNRLENIHPTQKPVALFEYLIKTYTNPGEIVLDNTAGSGTTAVAARNTGRRWICMERDETYFQKAIERVSATYRSAAA